MSNKAKIPEKDQRLLHTKSGNRCAMCKTILVDVITDSRACLGENAHIYGEKPESARYDKTQKTEFVNSEKNLIFLCCNCHKKIDTDIDKYSVDFLFDLKYKHEMWVMQELESGMINYTFKELEVLANHILDVGSRVQGTMSFDILKIEDKIKKNTLEEVQGYITTGLMNSKLIVDFINKHPSPSFSRKLNSIMVSEYQILKKEGKDSLTIFDELWDLTSGNRTDFKYRSAGLSILAYFFEECEVFEK